MLFLETSAKTAANCALVFETVAKKASGYVEASPRIEAPQTTTQEPPQSASEVMPPMSTNSSQDQ